MKKLKIENVVQKEIQKTEIQTEIQTEKKYISDMGIGFRVVEMKAEKLLNNLKNI